MSFTDFLFSLPLFTVSFGTFTIIDLLAASTNAFNGALLARSPSHYRNYTVVGIILMAFLGGIGGGVSRDVLLNKIPSAFTNPLYVVLCTVAAILALQIHYRVGQAFRKGLINFMTAFSFNSQETMAWRVPSRARLVLSIFSALSKVASASRWAW